MEAETIKSIAETKMTNAIQIGNYKLAWKIISRAAELLENTWRGDIYWRTKHTADIIEESIWPIDDTKSIKPVFKV